MIMTTLPVRLGLALFALTVAGGRQPLIAGDAAADPISVIPRPVLVTSAAGTFTLSASTVIWTDAGMAGVARTLGRWLEPATGFELTPRVGSASKGSRIVFQRDPALLKTLGAEGYRLLVQPDLITIKAAEPAGAFYAVQTLRQLLPPPIFREAKVEGVAWTIPAVTIDDQPRYSWRGSHLDVSRHFMPKEFVKKYIDLLALHKMNVFHWHLTDDQGWRIEIKKYPRLTSVGAWRANTRIGRPTRDTSAAAFDTKPHGGFYSQDDIREIVAYAADRFVTIVPEIEMPGHSQAAIAAYPSLGNTTDTVKVWNSWGVSPYILNPSDSTIAFMQDVLTEVMALFPGKYIHVGGDEATKPQWKASPLAQSRIKEFGLKDEDELQSWFIRQMDAFLTIHHRQLIGWDEILQGGVAPNAGVMNWRDLKYGIQAAQAGHDVVMTPNNQTYFDHYQVRPNTKEPLAIGGYLPIDTVYAYDPMPKGLDSAAAKHILGAQAQVWTEYMEGPKNVEYMAYPRMCALAEALWTPVARKDFSDFMTRLTTHFQRLDALDVNYRRP